MYRFKYREMRDGERRELYARKLSPLLPARLAVSTMYTCNRVCYFGCFFDLLIDLILSISRAKGPYMYNFPYAYAYAPSDMRRIILVLMHILIQPPSSYKSSFSYKTSDDAETHDPSTHATE